MAILGECRCIGCCIATRSPAWTWAQAQWHPPLPVAPATAGRRDRGAPGSNTTAWWLTGESQASPWGPRWYFTQAKEKGKTCQLAVIRAVTQSRRCLQSNTFTVINLAKQQGPAPHAHQIYSLPEVKAGLRSKAGADQPKAAQV